jgi:putative peptide zinc metalloprotease protein
MRKNVTRFLVLLTGLAGTPLLWASPAYADSAIGGGANNVVRVATTTGTELAQRAAVRVASYNGPFVNTTNVADAEAVDCVGCRSVAIAFQAVLAGGTPSTFTPGNAAAAATAGCTGCVAFAFAFQYVVSTPGPAHLTAAGRAAVDAVSAQVAEVAASGADPTSMCLTLTSLEQAFVDAISAPGSVDSGNQPVTVTARQLSAPTCL